ncbi:MAG TPA: STAS domain-containing protein [Tepidisphaeraceae bacterium]|jgi:anti-anti-sigma factor|nr:STAS domain-containing protein [Tepidisphaeraceae bacterium]
MPIEKWSEQVSVLHLADDPQLSDDLQMLEDQASQRKFDAVLDFGTVRFLNSSNLAKLLKLRNQLNQAESKMILCNVGTPIWGTFLVTGLDKVFDFSDNVTTALASLQIA